MSKIMKICVLFSYIFLNQLMISEASFHSFKLVVFLILLFILSRVDFFLLNLRWVDKSCFWIIREVLFVQTHKTFIVAVYKDSVVVTESSSNYVSVLLSLLITCIFSFSFIWNLLCIFLNFIRRNQVNFLVYGQDTKENRVGRSAK